MGGLHHKFELRILILAKCLQDKCGHVLVTEPNTNLGCRVSPQLQAVKGRKVLPVML